MFLSKTKNKYPKIIPIAFGILFGLLFSLQPSKASALEEPTLLKKVGNIEHYIWESECKHAKKSTLLFDPSYSNHKIVYYFFHGKSYPNATSKTDEKYCEAGFKLCQIPETYSDSMVYSFQISGKKVNGETITYDKYIDVPCLQNELDIQLQKLNLAKPQFTVLSAFSQGGSVLRDLAKNNQIPKNNIGIISFDACYSNWCSEVSKVPVSTRGKFYMYSGTTGKTKKGSENAVNTSDKDVRYIHIDKNVHSPVPSSCLLDHRNKAKCSQWDNLQTIVLAGSALSPGALDNSGKQKSTDTGNCYCIETKNPYSILPNCTNNISKINCENKQNKDNVCYLDSDQTNECEKNEYQTESLTKAGTCKCTINGNKTEEIHGAPPQSCASFKEKIVKENPGKTVACKLTIERPNCHCILAVKVFTAEQLQSKKEAKSIQEEEFGVVTDSESSCNKLSTNNGDFKKNDQTTKFNAACFWAGNTEELQEAAATASAQVQPPQTFPAPELNIPIPGMKPFEDLKLTGTEEAGAELAWIPQYISAIYIFGVGLATIIATITILIGGIYILTAGGQSGRVSTGQELIKRSIIGLVLAMGSYFILFTINPETTTLKILNIQTLETSELEVHNHDAGDIDTSPTTDPTATNKQIGKFFDGTTLCKTPAACVTWCEQNPDKSTWPTHNKKTIDPSLTTKIPNMPGIVNETNSKGTAELIAGLKKAGQIAISVDPEYVIKVRSAFRPLKKQIALVCARVESGNPDSISKIGKIVAYPGGSNHGSGIATDIQLWKGNKKLVTSTAKEQNNPKYKEPAKLFANIMEQAGFVRYAAEIWHFELKSKSTSGCRCSGDNCPFPTTCKGF